MTGSGKELVPAARSAGRPSAYSIELAEEICRRISIGETLIDVCEDANMPPESTVRGWDWDDRNGRCPPRPGLGFSTLYARAKEMRLECELDRLRTLTREEKIGRTVIHKQAYDSRTGDVVDLTEIRYGDMVQARALEAEALKWRIAKIGWRVYGPKQPVPVLPEGAGDHEASKTIIEGGLPDPPADPPLPP